MAPYTLPPVKDDQNDTISITVTMDGNVQPYVAYVKSKHQLVFTEHTTGLKKNINLQLTLEDDNTEVGSMSQTYELTIFCTYCVTLKKKTVQREWVEPVVNFTELI